MPIHLVPYLLSSGTSISIVHPNLVAGIVFVVAVLVLRRWSNGKDLITRLYLREQELEEQRQKLNKGKSVEFTRRREVERDLHGLTFLVVCTFTPSSLLLLSALSNRGAQLILLLPSTAFTPPSLPSTLQYLQLLRDGTNNQLLFAEECDLFSYTSIEGFVKRWNEGEGGGGTGVGPAGGRAASGIGMSGGNEDGAASGGGTSRAPRRCDGIVFLPYTVRQMEQSGNEHPLQGTDQLKNLSKRELLGRFHLINSLLSTLLLLPPERDIRILQWVSPWYSAGLQKFCDEEQTKSSDGNTLKRTASQSSPTISSYGSTTLSSLLLFHELQRRLILLAEADPRPRNPLPGIISPDDDGPKLSSVDDDSKQRRAHLPNVNVVNICPGFERDGEVWQWLWPAMPSPQTSTFLQRLLIHLRRCCVLLFWPLLMVIAKSPKMAVDQFIWGLVAPLDVKGGCERLLVESTLPPLEDGDDLGEKGSKTAPQDAKSTFGANTNTTNPSAAFVGSGSIRLLPPPEEDEEGWRGIQPARLYREGKLVRIAPRTVQSNSKPGLATETNSWWTEGSLTARWLRWEQSVEQWRGGSVKKSGRKEGGREF